MGLRQDDQSPQCKQDFARSSDATNGLTKTEISSQVLNRHVSSADIDEALTDLHGLKIAYYEIETTEGAPKQRWFACLRSLTTRRRCCVSN